MGFGDEEGKTEKHFAIVTRVTDNRLGDQLRGAVYFKSDTLTGDSEFGEPAEPSFGLAGKKGEGFFWVPQVGDQIEVEINTADEHMNPKYTRMIYSDVDDIAPEFKKNYPFRMGWKTRAGHIFYFDNKEDALAIKLMHTIGTGFEWDKDGNEIKNVVKDLIETIKGKVVREVTDQVMETFKAEVKRTYDAKVSEKIKGDWKVDAQGAIEMKSKKDVKMEATKKAEFKGKAGTDIGTPASITNIFGALVNLAGGGLPVARVGSQTIGTGNLGIPVISYVIDGSPLVTAP